jgi:hypothetical protein
MLASVMQRVQLNVDVSREAYEAAKRGADDCGMFLRRWVEKALLEKAGKVPGREQSAEMGALGGREVE